MSRTLKLAVASTLLMLSSVAAARSAEICDVSGRWQIVHGNRAVARMNIIQDGGSLSGSGIEGRNAGFVEGGRISGRNVSFTVSWSPNRARGEYNGTINARGRLSGESFDQRNAQNQTTWFVNKFFECRETGRPRFPRRT